MSDKFPFHTDKRWFQRRLHNGLVHHTAPMEGDFCEDGDNVRLCSEEEPADEQDGCLGYIEPSYRQLHGISISVRQRVTCLEWRRIAVEMELPDSDPTDPAVN
jgi:hypothetical protein